MLFVEVVDAVEAVLEMVLAIVWTASAGAAARWCCLARGGR